MLLSAALVLALFAPLQDAPRPAPAAAPAGRLVVLNKHDHTASILDPETGAELALVPTGEAPHEVAVSPDGTLAVVANYGAATPGHTLTVIEIASGEVLDTIDLGRYGRPHGIVFPGPDLRVLVTAETQRALLEVDLAEGRVIRRLGTDQDTSHMVAVSPAGDRAWVANIGSGSVSVFDLASGKRLANVPCGAGTEGLAVRPGGAEVWATNRAANTVTVLDAETLEVRATVPTPGFPIRVAFTPDGSRALVSCAEAGLVAVFEAGPRKLLAEIPMAWKAAEGAAEHLFKDFGESPVPVGIVVRPDGAQAFVANTNANRIAVIDLRGLAVRGTLTAGREPDGMAWAPAP